jgi:hypothetical protein
MFLYLFCKNILGRILHRHVLAFGTSNRQCGHSKYQLIEDVILGKQMFTTFWKTELTWA